MPGGRKKTPDQDAYQPVTYLPAVSPRYGAEHFRLFAKKYLKVPHGQGAGKPLKLHEFQLDAVRGFLEEKRPISLWISPRGQSKSTTLAALAIFVMVYAPEPNQLNSIVAQSDARALALLKTMRQFVEMSEELEPRFTFWRDRAVYHPNGAEIVAVASTMSAVEGSIVTGVTLVDEIGFTENDVFESMLLSMKSDKARLFAASTPSPWRLRDKTPLFGLRQAALSGDPDISLYETGADPKDDPLAWETILKANPALEAGIMSERSVRASLPPKVSMDEHKRARLAMWPQQAIGEAWMPHEAWHKAEYPVPITPGSKVAVGIDCSQRWDSTVICIASVSKRPHVQLYRIWENPDRDQEFQVPMTEVGDTIREIADRYHVVDVSYDPYAMGLLANQLEQEGLPMRRFVQTPKLMGSALIEVRGLIAEGRVTVCENATLSRHVMNALLKPVGAHYLLEKPDKNSKIDAAVAMTIALTRAFYLGVLKPRSKSMKGKRTR